MCYIDLDPCTVWRESERKARKAHRCSCCCRTIEVGEKYIVHFSIFEGDKLSNKCCYECNGDRMTFATAHEGNLPTPDFFPQMLAECISEGDDDEDDPAARWQPMLDRIEASRKRYRELRDRDKAKD
jgi:hypothetical protein